MNICKICNQENKFIFNAEILQKYNIVFYYCSNCGFLQTENPFWLEEAYSESINVSDTGYMQRNLNFSKKVMILLVLFFNKNSKFLDYAAGYGVFVRFMRDLGFDFYWNDKYTSNLFSKGFEFNNENDIEAITTFESFEHFENPIKEIEKILKISKNIILSTELLPEPIPKPVDWWYYGLDHGQHLSFYSDKTFQFIADKYGLNYYNLGSLKLLTERTIPIYSKTLIKFSKFGLHRLLQKKLKSKIWDDYLKMSGTK